jgi:hypothetical protein
MHTKPAGQPSSMVCIGSLLSLLIVLTGSGGGVTSTFGHLGHLGCSGHSITACGQDGQEGSVAAIATGVVPRAPTRVGLHAMKISIGSIHAAMTKPQSGTSHDLGVGICLC